MQLPFSDERTLSTIGRQHEVPVYVYDPGLAASRMSRLRGELSAAAGSRVGIAYAVKANPHPGILVALADTGCGFDVASGGELDRVLARGVEGSRMVFSGPGKARADVERALAAGVRINCEGERDLRHVAAWAERSGCEVAVNLRVNPLGDGPRSIIGGGGPSRFGVDEGVLDAVLDRWSPHPRVRIRGVQVFTASNLLQAGDLARHHRQAMQVARRVQQVVGFALDTVDLGGGLGIPYRDEDVELDIAALASSLGSLLRENPWFEGQLLLEPGRWITGPCGIYLCHVLEVKESQGKRFAVLDGGIHHLLRPALLGMDQPCSLLPRASGEAAAGELVPTTLGGPLCTGIDILARDVPLPPLEEGDVIAFLQTGAYGETEAMPEFLLHPRAQVLLL